MNKTYSWNIFGHQWNNFKSWVNCCEKNFGKDAILTYGKLQEMIEYVDTTTEKLDDKIIEYLSGEKLEEKK